MRSYFTFIVRHVLQQYVCVEYKISVGIDRNIHEGRARLEDHVLRDELSHHVNVLLEAFWYVLLSYTGEEGQTLSKGTLNLFLDGCELGHQSFVLGATTIRERHLHLSFCTLDCFQLVVEVLSKVVLRFQFLHAGNNHLLNLWIDCVLMLLQYLVLLCLGRRTDVKDYVGFLRCISSK